MNYLSFNNNAHIFNDIILEICKFLKDVDKIRFLSVCNHNHSLKGKILYTCPVIVDKISSLWYFNNFTKVIIIFDIGIIPYYVKKIYLGNFISKKINEHIPEIWKWIKSYDNFSWLLSRPMPFLTHVSFGTYFNDPVHFIPSTVTHLSFSNIFNKEIKHIISSITHLFLGKYYDRPTIFPQSIIKLYAPGMFHFPIHSLSNVEYLTINLYYPYKVEISDYPKLKRVDRIR